MKFGVIVFPGSGCSSDIAYILRELLEQQVVEIWHKSSDLQGVDAVIIADGFSHDSDNSSKTKQIPVMEKIKEFAGSGGFVIGISGGFQMLCNAGLLPGSLLKNENGRFICKNVFIKAETRRSPVSSTIGIDCALKIPIAHSEGKYFADNSTLITMRQNDQILFRYCDSEGKVSRDFNPDGSVDNIAGVCNSGKNVFGLMPHPERAADAELGNTDGVLIFKSVIANFHKA